MVENPVLVHIIVNNKCGNRQAWKLSSILSNSPLLVKNSLSNLSCLKLYTPIIKSVSSSMTKKVQQTDMPKWRLDRQSWECKPIVPFSFAVRRVITAIHVCYTSNSGKAWSLLLDYICQYCKKRVNEEISTCITVFYFVLKNQIFVTIL